MTKPRTLKQTKTAFLKALRKLKVISQAAAAVGIPPNRHDTWMRNDPAYRQRYEKLKPQLKGPERKQRMRTAFDSRKEMNQRAFLAAYETCGSIGVSARAAKISRNAHYMWMAADADYREHFAAAMETASEFLEGEARRRAIDGVRRYKFYQRDPLMWDNPETGKREQYYEMDYSDAMLIYLLKVNNPQKYRIPYDPSDWQPGGPAGYFQIDRPSPEEWERRFVEAPVDYDEIPLNDDLALAG